MPGVSPIIFEFHIELEVRLSIHRMCSSLPRLTLTNLLRAYPCTSMVAWQMSMLTCPLRPTAVDQRSAARQQYLSPPYSTFPNPTIHTRPPSRRARQALRRGGGHPSQLSRPLRSARGHLPSPPLARRRTVTNAHTPRTSRGARTRTAAPP